MLCKYKVQKQIRLAYTYEITELSSSKLMMRTAGGPFPMETTHQWEALEAERTRMKLRNRGEPKGFSRLLAPVISKMMRKANTKDFQNLKRIFEANS